MLVDAFFFQFINDLDFRCNAGMIGTRLPEGIIALHSLPADQNILHGIVKCMAHVKFTGNVRRRDHDGEGFLCFIHFCMEILLFFPLAVKAIFNALGIVGLGEFFLHIFSSLRLIKKALN